MPPRPASAHSGSPAHDHPAAPDHPDRRFALAVALNTGFVAAETVAGLLSGSLALLADAGHNLGDVLGLLLAWGAAALARRPPTVRRTYGLRRTTTLAALANALLLLVAVGAIAWEALERLRAPVAVDGTAVVWVAGLGIAVNAASAALFARGRDADLNLRGAFLHLAADAAVSLGVVVAGVLVLATGRAWIDPLTSLLVAAIILAGTWRLLRDALSLAVDAVPPGIDVAAVRRELLALAGVDAVHDLHVWGMSTTEAALTAHLVMPGGAPGDAFLRAAAAALHDRFGIEHVTLQVETGDGEPCDHCPPGEAASASRPRLAR
jgi:cobalt-zinc-cadmium efflux system protein